VTRVRVRRPFDYPYFPPRDDVRERATQVGFEAVLAELVAESDQQTARANALLTAAVFALATTTVLGAAAGLGRWQYAVTVTVAGVAFASALTTQVIRVGKRSIALEAELTDVDHAYSAVSRKARWLEAATWMVSIALVLLAAFALTLT